MIFSLFALLNLNIFLTSVQHPIHVSVTNVEYREAEKKFKISLRTFTDDFQSAINKNEKSTIKFHNPPSEKEKILISDYLNKNIKLSFNDSKENTTITVKKIEFKEENVLWIDSEIKSGKALKKVKLANTFLFDLYPDQKNLMIFSYKTIKEALTFERKKPESVIEIK